MVVKFLGNGSVTIAQDNDVRNWGISKKRNFAMINKINNKLRIFQDSTFGMVTSLGR